MQSDKENVANIKLPPSAHALLRVSFIGSNIACVLIPLLLLVITHGESEELGYDLYSFAFPLQISAGIGLLLYALAYLIIRNHRIRTRNYLQILLLNLLINLAIAVVILRSLFAVWFFFDYYIYFSLIVSMLYLINFIVASVRLKKLSKTSASTGQATQAGEDMAAELSIIEAPSSEVVTVQACHFKELPRQVKALYGLVIAALVIQAPLVLWGCVDSMLVIWMFYLATSIVAIGGLFVTGNAIFLPLYRKKREKTSELPQSLYIRRLVVSLNICIFVYILSIATYLVLDELGLSEEPIFWIVFIVRSVVLGLVLLYPICARRFPGAVRRFVSSDHKTDNN